ncbi:MAG: GtrA family protein [Pseudomonadota bacterium]
MLTRQLTRYLIAGGLGTLTHLAVLALCVEVFGWSPVAGAVAGFLGALSVSYVLNHHWAFESRRSHIGSFWRYTLVSLGGLALNTAMMAGLVHYLHWWYFTAQLSVIFVVPLINFVLNRYWTFDAAGSVER